MVTVNERPGDAHIATYGAPQYGPSEMDQKGLEVSARTAVTSTRETKSFRLGPPTSSTSIDHALTRAKSPTQDNSGRTCPKDVVVGNYFPLLARRRVAGLHSLFGGLGVLDVFDSSVAFISDGVRMVIWHFKSRDSATLLQRGSVPCADQYRQRRRFIRLIAFEIIRNKLFSNPIVQPKYISTDR